jgi:hypothetical protein
MDCLVVARAAEATFASAVVFGSFRAVLVLRRNVALMLVGVERGRFTFNFHLEKFLHGETSRFFLIGGFLPSSPFFLVLPFSLRQI